MVQLPLAVVLVTVLPPAMGAAGVATQFTPSTEETNETVPLQVPERTTPTEEAFGGIRYQT
jgi:hypothetical protein